MNDAASTSSPAPRPAEPGFLACMKAIAEPEIYRNFAIHLFIMAPGVVVMCLLARQIDRVLGLERLLPWPVSAWPGAVMIAIGGLSVWYVYGYLLLAGGGSPGTHVDGGPTALVDTGPYTVLRHPSVPGKFMAAAGVGVIFASPSFLFIFLPILLVYSLLTNRYLQEPTCDKRFGGVYEVYRRTVPMVFPRPSGIGRWLKGRAAVADADRPEPHIHPAEASSELAWYLTGLVGMILLFGAIALAVRIFS